MKGVILAGSSATRPDPVTLGLSKKMLLIYDNPTGYRHQSAEMLYRISDIFITMSQRDAILFYSTLGDGSSWDINLRYIVQETPRGLADAFIVGEEFIDTDRSALILGDNLFYGARLDQLLDVAAARTQGATGFAQGVVDPHRFGVVEFDEIRRAVHLEEKPANPRSNWAVTGLDFYDSHVVQIAKSIKPIPRGELEITDVNRAYLDKGLLDVQLMRRGYAWIDTGTHESLRGASEFVRAIEHRQGFKVACLEEIALGRGWMTKTEVLARGAALRSSSYGEYLMEIAQ